MKVCKKCKKKVANKAKICKYCGADVTKAKIIKTAATNTKKATNTKNTTNKITLIEEKSKTNKQPKKVEKKEITINKEQSANKNTITETFIKFLVYILLEIFNSLKTTVVVVTGSLKDIFKTLFKASKQTIKLVKGIKNTNKIKKIEKKKIKEQAVEIEETEDAFENPKKVKSKKYKRIRFASTILFIAILCGGGYYGYKYIYNDVVGEKIHVVAGEKATTDKVFSMNDVITYNDVDYKIVKIETSKGNNYKSPKAGHQFLIVTVYIKNNSKGKAAYSYENWTMSNSKGEEKKRIFTSINVDTALYSGELVVGGIKTGSMVFEQPINDQKLKMNYYELKKDKDGNEVIDQSKRIFSISVKSPDKIKKQSDIPNQEDSKVIKNS